MSIKIPSINPNATGRHDGIALASVQPIMWFKELEIDWVRYEAWKVEINKRRTKRKGIQKR